MKLVAKLTAAAGGRRRAGVAVGGYKPPSASPWLGGSVYFAPGPDPVPEKLEGEPPVAKSKGWWGPAR